MTSSACDAKRRVGQYFTKRKDRSTLGGSAWGRVLVRVSPQKRSAMPTLTFLPSSNTRGSWSGTQSSAWSPSTSCR